MTPAGWYDDPHVLGQIRYWDGERWTEHVHAQPQVPAASPPPELNQELPAVVAPPFASGVSRLGADSRSHGGKINDVGDWLGRAFSGVFSGFVPLSAFLVIPLAIGALGYLALDQGLRGASLDADRAFVGYSVPLLALAAVLAFVALLSCFPIYLASVHNMYGGHVGRSPSAMESLRVGLRTSPRLIGVCLVMIVGFAALIGLFVAMIFGPDAVGVGGLAGLSTAVAFIVFFCVFFWLWVKLRFVGVAAAVVPGGTPVLSTAWNATTGYFWPIFGRVFLLAFLVGIISRIAEFVSSTILAGVIFSRFEVTADERLLLDGVPLEVLPVIELSDLLPNPILMIVILGAAIYGLTMIGWFETSGAAALYADLGAPNTFGHGRD